MINVAKKELKERTYVPYEITLTINSADDHKTLVSDVQALRQVMTGEWYRLGQTRYPSLMKVIKEIETHL